MSVERKSVSKDRGIAAYAGCTDDTVTATSKTPPDAVAAMARGGPSRSAACRCAHCSPVCGVAGHIALVWLSRFASA